ncbi:uncharacterized protein [Ptychodera flava]|uniref:uncharacterized protein n=1 Tax=Ptychodera flava TaxID=63121 RepID=UPI003969C6CC
MEGKVAMITGGCGGIGRALAERFLQEGAKSVSIIDINDERANDVVKELTQSHGTDRVSYIHCDVTSETEFRAAFDETKRKYGAINVLCNNAGILNEIEWEKTLDINLVVALPFKLYVHLIRMYRVFSSIAMVFSPEILSHYSHGQNTKGAAIVARLVGIVYPGNYNIFGVCKRTLVPLTLSKMKFVKET